MAASNSRYFTVDQPMLVDYEIEQMDTNTDDDIEVSINADDINDINLYDDDTNTTPSEWYLPERKLTKLCNVLYLHADIWGEENVIPEDEELFVELK
jgi:hypothetical protein